jgi:nucleoid-associated protein YgaU
VINAIFDANRAIMPSANDLRVGQELVLPEIDGMTLNAPAPSSATEPEKPAPPSPEPESELRYYQVKKGDLYATIAKEQLGDAGRWKEIAELNSDIFPDPSKIRYGVRIRLPARTAGGSGEPRS